MTSFVTKYLIQANIILTFCILVVLAVRFLIRRYARIFSYFAWGIVCFGLVYFFVSPLQFPLHAVYSFLSGKSGQNETATAGDAVVTQTFPDGTAAVNDLSAPPAVSDGRAMAGTGLPDKIAAISPDFLQIPHPEEWMRDVHFTRILFGVWLAGILIFLIHFLYSYIRVKRTIRFAIKLRENIFELDGYITPFVFGVFHAKIYIPYGLEEEEIALIAAHERCHIRYRHHIVLLLAKLIWILFWMNPFVWMAYQKLSLDMELFCDEHATKKLSISEKRAYSILLAQMASKGRIIDAVYFSSRASVLKKRVTNILESKKRNLVFPVCLLTSCLIVVAAGTGAYAAANDNSLWNGGDSDKNGDANQAVISQEDLDQRLTALGLQDSGMNIVILDEAGNILAQKGNIDEKVPPGSAARPVIAADILAGGEVTYDSIVKGNSILCFNQNGEQENYSNWGKEPEEITFQQALTGHSMVGLISAALNTDISSLKNTLEKQGFVNFDPASESSIASCVSGQDMKISVHHLADAYCSIFMREENSQLRQLMKYDLQQRSEDYVDDADMSGSYGIGFEVVSGDPSIPGAIVQLSATAVFAGDCYLDDQRVIIAISRYYEDISKEDPSGSYLMSVANALLISEE